MHKITEELGGRTVEEYESVMSLNEFRCWEEYYKIKEEERKKRERKRKNSSSSRRRKPSLGRR